MGKIRVLSDHVASQVAAGEVVERPASVFKELVENSLDAKASRIDVEFVRAGVQLFRIQDDGIGMDRDDALLCLERHATSKITNSQDLETVGTYGFRGEAMPSIASVSKMRILTRPAHATVGTEILIEGGRVKDVREAGCAQGTLIDVRALFENVPARKKFLRSEATEAAHLLSVFHSTALVNYGIHFSLSRAGENLYRLPAASHVEARVRDLFGGVYLERFCPYWEMEIGGMKVSGFVSRPGFVRSTKTQQFVFLNRRFVQLPMVGRAVREALLGEAEGVGLPPLILFLEMDSRSFDCNVHPAKREVRLHNPQEVREAVYQFACAAAKEGLIGRRGNGGMEKPMLSNLDDSAAASALKVDTTVACLLTGDVETAKPSLVSIFKPVEEVLPFVPAAQPATRADSSLVKSADPKGDGMGMDFQFLSRLGKRYFLLESGEGLVLVDLRFALERVYYERLIRGAAWEDGRSQRLLAPVVFEIDPHDFAWVSQNQSILTAVGFSVEAFGERAVKIDALPADFSGSDPQELLCKMLGQIRTGASSTAFRFARNQVALSLCRLRGLQGTMVDKLDAAAFLKELFACELPYASPFGNPTMIHLGWSELERKFGR